jgi:hypothetical protein
MRTIIITLDSGQQLDYELAWTPVADIVWDRLVDLSYTTALSIDHQWHDSVRDSVTGLCLSRTYHTQPQPIPDDLWSYFCYQPRPGDLCLDPLTEGRDLVTAWRGDRRDLVQQQQLQWPQQITDNLLLYWSVVDRRANSGLRREIWRWLSQHDLTTELDWSRPQSHCHGRALVAYVRDHSQLATVTAPAEIQSIKLAV